MSQQKPISASTPETKPQQPTSTELSAAELDLITGGDKSQQTTTTTSTIHITKVVDKASPYLF